MLTNENYHSKEMNSKYMSVSQFKALKFGCQARTIAELNGEYERTINKSMLVGSYVDAHFSGQMELFKAKNPNIISSRGASAGQLKAEFSHANDIIRRIEEDKLFFEHTKGETQVIKTGFIEGVEFKSMYDFLHKEKIVDLKIMRDFKKIYKDGLYLNFIEYWGYDFQGAIYQEIEGNKLPFIIAVATSEPVPDIALLEIPQERLDYCLDIVRNSVEELNLIKNGLQEPERCGLCDYCKSTKKLDKVVAYDEFFNDY